MLINVRGLFFDMDGTLVKQKLDFNVIKNEINAPEEIPILEHLNTLQEPKKSQKQAILEFHEHKAAVEAEACVGLKELQNFLHRNRFKIAVITRNSRAFAEITLKKIGFKYDYLLGREDAPYKPNPGAVLKALEFFELKPDEAIMIGDYKFDVISGKNAGCFTCFVANGRNNIDSADADFVIQTLDELSGLFEPL